MPATIALDSYSLSGSGSMFDTVVLAIDVEDLVNIYCYVAVVPGSRYYAFA